MVDDRWQAKNKKLSVHTNPDSNKNQIEIPTKDGIKLYFTWLREYKISIDYFFLSLV